MILHPEFSPILVIVSDCSQGEQIVFSVYRPDGFFATRKLYKQPMLILYVSLKTYTHLFTEKSNHMDPLRKKSDAHQVF